MPNLKFSQFVEKTDPANVQFLVGYNGTENVKIEPSNVADLSGYLPLTGGTLTGTLDISSSSGLNQITSSSAKVLASHDTATETWIYAGGNLTFDTPADIASISNSLGIKVANPARELDIDGDIQLTDTSFAAKRGIYGPLGELASFNGLNFDYLVSGGSIRFNPVVAQMNFNVDGNFDFLSHDGGSGETIFSYSGSEKMRIEASGNVGIGTTSPSALLEVAGDILGGGNVEFDGGDAILIRNKPTLSQKLVTLWEHPTDRIQFGDIEGGYSGATFNIEYKNDVAHLFKMRLGIDNSTPSYPLDVDGEGRFTGDVRANSFINTSDSSLKDNIKDIRTDLVSLRYKEYTLKDDKYGKTRYGILAEDLKDTHPEFVHYNDRGEAGVDYISLLVKKIAELETRLAELETRLNDAGIK